jgi:hypothetical protein
MSATMSTSASLCWCQLPVPQELETEVLCVQHFLTTVEHDCSDRRREIAIGKTTPARQAEIAEWVKATANKLTIVAYGRLRLSDEYKKRILTTCTRAWIVRPIVRPPFARIANCRSFSPLSDGNSPWVTCGFWFL